MSPQESAAALHPSLGERVCGKCSTPKASSEFYQKAADRLDPWCKVCRKQERRERYKACPVPSPMVEVRPKECISLVKPEPIPESEPIERPASFDPNAPHTRVPYTQGEAAAAIDAILILRKVRDRCRAQGLIDW